VSELTSVPCAEIDPEPVRWLWEPYLARGKLALLDGDPGGASALARNVFLHLGQRTVLPAATDAFTTAPHSGQERDWTDMKPSSLRMNESGRSG